MGYQRRVHGEIRVHGESTADSAPRDSFSMAKPDPCGDIDFDEVTEATGLAIDEIKCLKVCFDLFDTKKQEFLSADDLDEIMRAMGFLAPLTDEELDGIIEELDEDGSGSMDFDEFCEMMMTKPE